MSREDDWWIKVGLAGRGMYMTGNGGVYVEARLGQVYSRIGNQPWGSNNFGGSRNFIRKLRPQASLGRSS